MDGGFFIFFLTALSTRKHGEIWACGRVTRTLLILVRIKPARFMAMRRRRPLKKWPYRTLERGERMF